MNNKPQLLDLFCGAGGAAMGYHRAGFEVVGVDINPQPHYPFEFHQADALEFPLEGFDVIHASPPCQRWSSATRLCGRPETHPDHLTPIRERLQEAGIPFVIENVYGAPLQTPLMLCGLMFGLKMFRHRYFECSPLLLAVGHPSHRGKRIGEGYYCVVGGGGPWKSKSRGGGLNNGPLAEWRKAMGIDWMRREELTQAIPPAYTEYLGRQLLNGNSTGESSSNT